MSDKAFIGHGTRLALLVGFVFLSAASVSIAEDISLSSEVLKKMSALELRDLFMDYPYGDEQTQLGAVKVLRERLRSDADAQVLIIELFTQIRMNVHWSVLKEAAYAIGSLGEDSDTLIDPLISKLGQYGEPKYFDTINKVDWALLRIGTPKATKAVFDYFKQADINARNEEGDTPLIQKCRHISGSYTLEIVDVYLRIGADPNLIDRNGDTAYALTYFSDAKEKSEVLRLLEKKGAKQPDMSVNYNTLGYREYKKRNLVRAAECFRRATMQRPNDPLPWYNRACTLSIMGFDNDTDYIFGNQGRTIEILKNLRKAIDLDPARKKRALEDPDLKAVHNTLFFRILNGSFDPNSDKEIRDLLLKKEFGSDNNCGNGLSGDYLRFEESGRVSAGCGNNFARYSSEEESSQNDHLQLAKGFSIEKGIIKLESPKTDVSQLRFYFDGVEAHVEEITSGKNLARRWNEITGYIPSP